MSTTPGTSAPTTAASKEFLRQLPLFADLAEDDLDELHRMASLQTVPAGAPLFEQGSPGECLYVLVEGEVEVSRRDGDQRVVLAVRRAGELIGEMSLVGHAPRSASVRALTDTTLLVISQTAFQTLLSCSRTAPLTILRTMTDRLRSTESLLMQQEKMAALGTLAAGLAHELNNPAAAIRRSTAQLGDVLAAWEARTAELAAVPLETGGLQTLLDWLREHDLRTPDSLRASARGSREDELQRWLEDQGVERAWEVAPALAAGGVSLPTLSELAERVPRVHLSTALHWLALRLEVKALLAESRISATAISALVSAVKSYSHLDRAPVQQVDVHESLENTLVILYHKTKAGITITREYAEDLPLIEAYASELNQVWTNLIDNAIAAMEGTGELGLRTAARGEEILVEIVDNGPGIAAELQSRIFEPFFTTKAAGAGTGLGLHIAHNIVVLRHGGHIQVQSVPGETCFQIRLPVRLKRTAA